MLESRVSNYMFMIRDNYFVLNGKSISHNTISVSKAPASNLSYNVSFRKSIKIVDIFTSQQKRKSHGQHSEFSKVAKFNRNMPKKFQKYTFAKFADFLYNFITRWNCCFFLRRKRVRVTNKLLRFKSSWQLVHDSRHNS